jgi:hypothetical protein
MISQRPTWSRSHGDQRVVVARRHEFEHVTWDQVRKMFAASDITLIAESDITAMQPPS